MGSQQITVALCLALLVICSAAPSLTRRDNEEVSLSNETPEKLAEDVAKHQKGDEYNEHELNGGVEGLAARQVEGLADTSSAIASGFSQSNPQQLQQLKEFLSLEVNNKDKFAQIYSQMNPEQVKKIREHVLRVGQQTGNQELIKLGQCKSPRFNQNQVATLMALGESLYERLNTDTGVQVNRALGDGSNDNAMFNQLKTSISNQQDFIRRLVNMIEVQLSKAPQIDEVEFAEIKQITEQIKSLSAQVQTQLGEATELSQLTKMGDELLQINNLSSQLQQKVSAELLEERIKEYLGSIPYENNQQQATENTDSNHTFNRRSTATGEATESNGNIKDEIIDSNQNDMSSAPSKDKVTNSILIETNQQDKPSNYTQEEVNVPKSMNDSSKQDSTGEINIKCGPRHDANYITNEEKEATHIEHLNQKENGENNESDNKGEPLKIRHHRKHLIQMDNDREQKRTGLGDRTFIDSKDDAVNGGSNKGNHIMKSNIKGESQPQKTTHETQLENYEPVLTNQNNVDIVNSQETELNMKPQDSEQGGEESNQQRHRGNGYRNRDNKHGYDEHKPEGRSYNEAR